MNGLPTSVLIWTAAILVPVGILLPILSALVERSGPVRLRHWAQEADGRLRAVFEEPGRFEAFRYLLSFSAKAVPVVLAVLLGTVGMRLGWFLAAPLAVLAVAALLLLAEWLSRGLVRGMPEEMLRLATPVYKTLMILGTPWTALLGPLLKAEEIPGREPEDEEELSDEEIEAYIDFGAREGILEPDERELLRGLVDFGDTQVKSVMTPRIDVTCTPIDTGLDAMRELFLTSGHSRIPLYEGSIDRVVGILHIRDLLRALGPPKRSSARDLAKPPFFVPETKPLGELLKEMQAAHQQMAMVVDEYGGTSGLVTIEDLLEEIVGEIIDEHEVERPEVEPLPDGSWRLDGRVHVETLEERFGLDLGETPAETVGGLVFATLGYVPEVGDSIELRDYRVWVESLQDRRIETLRLEKRPEGETAAPEPVEQEYD